MTNNTKHTGSALIINKDGKETGAVDINNGMVTVTNGTPQDNPLGTPKPPKTPGGPQKPEGN
jgi:hypothetical protein